MKISKTVFSMLCIELAFVLFIVVFWASNKGFEFSDEAYSVLSIIQSSESPDAFYFQHIINFFFGWLNPGFVGLRLLRLFLTFFAAVFLAFKLSGLLVFKEHSKSAKNKLKLTVLSSICFISLLLSYAIYPQVISYNNLTEIGLCFIAALLIGYSLNVIDQKDRSAKRSAFFLGLAAMFVFYCRFTSGIILFVTIPFLLLAIRFKKSDLKKLGLVDVVYSIAGIISMFIFTSLLIYSNVEWIQRLSESLKYMPGHSVSAILDTYWQSAMYMVENTISVKLIFPLLLLVILSNKSRLEEKEFENLNLYQILSFSYLLVFIVFLWTNDFLFSGVKFISSAIFFHLLMLLSVFSVLFSKGVFASIRKSFWKNSHLLAIGIFLFFIPLIGSLGTNNSLHIQFLQFVFSWILLSILFLYKVRKQVGQTLAGGLILIMLIGSFSQTIHGLVYSPYRIPGTLIDQKIVKNFTNGDRLLVDPRTHSVISNFENLMTQLPTYKKGDPMIVLMSIPGYIYLAEAGVVKNAWTNSAFPETVCFSVNNSKRNDLDKTVIISPRSRGMNPIILNCFQQKGINFPESYLPRYSFTDPVYGMEMDLYTKSTN